ncbi:hypothetical protein FE257_003166 [Aspergillus nanangensis]|uniref:Gag1-like clamp domain-containing protein n=1 Tax=Aspergillus nanangensis TaxID=2582783 RepID=A0AAD4CC55_ASPNN|nr:hypothetical protein FE257_003166 [Aspergillus nanangensis]
MSTEARDAAIRDTKRYVREIIRNDWDFEPSTDAGLPARCSPLNPVHEVKEWRLRAYDSSGSELEPQASPSAIGSRDPTGYDSSEPSSPVLSPIGGRTERRRKRRRQMEEEMRWNEGLRTWVERRDAWSGARTRLDHRREEEGRSSDGVIATGATTSASGLESDSQDTFSGSTSSRPLSSRSQESPPTMTNDLATKAEGCLNIAENEDRDLSPEQQSQLDRDGEDHSADQEAKRKASTETAITEPDPSHKMNTPMAVNTPTPAPATVAATAMASSIHHNQSCASDDPLIPVVPSFISDANPIRASITPSMYPSIYSKVVIQGLTPTVPINLADLTKAMVQGWKSDGQWPPKPTNIVLADDATVPRVNHAADRAADKPSSPESKRRSGVASAVRKVLNFSAFHPHPFHRRSSTSHNNEHHEGQAAEGTSSVAAGSAKAAHTENR